MRLDRLKSLSSRRNVLLENLQSLIILKTEIIEKSHFIVIADLSQFFDDDLIARSAVTKGFFNFINSNLFTKSLKKKHSPIVSQGCFIEGKLYFLDAFVHSVQSYLFGRDLPKPFL